MVDGKVVEDPEDEVETPEDDVESGSNTTCCGWCRQTEKQQTDEVAITASDGDVSAEDLDESEKVPLTAPEVLMKVPLTAQEVETLEDDADTAEMTSINTKEEHTAGITAGEETDGKTEL